MADQAQDPEPGDFEDPLENYEPKTYDDALEQALDEQPVSAIEVRPFTTASPDITVERALQILVDQDVACLLIEEDGKLIGVFSDRDALNHVALDYAAMKDQPVRSVMTTDPAFVRESDSSAAALSVMAVMGYRHVPVLNAQDKIMGIVSPRRVSEFLLSHLG